MYHLRTKETYERYHNKIKRGHLENGCRLCEAEAVLVFDYWQIIDNSFPYDRIAQTHHMLIPKQHGDENALSELEKTELLKLKYGGWLENYDFIFESLPQGKSIPAHHHLHLIKVKEFTT